MRGLEGPLGRAPWGTAWQCVQSGYSQAPSCAACPGHAHRWLCSENGGHLGRAALPLGSLLSPFLLHALRQDGWGVLGRTCFPQALGPVRGQTWAQDDSPTPPARLGCGALACVWLWEGPAGGRDPAASSPPPAGLLGPGSSGPKQKASCPSLRGPPDSGQGDPFYRGYTVPHPGQAQGHQVPTGTREGSKELVGPQFSVLDPFSNETSQRTPVCEQGGP